MTYIISPKLKIVWLGPSVVFIWIETLLALRGIMILNIPKNIFNITQTKVNVEVPPPSVSYAAILKMTTSVMIILHITKITLCIIYE